MLATVGSAPDFMLTIWNWEQEKINLRYKAFGQDVFNVSFSDTNDGQLVTSGSGHIKFWKMAQTFTGLKLQGQIGKFGKVDISDIAGYAILPDGKVLSGSENGKMLLWEGNLIKTIVTKPEGTPCHNGTLDVVVLTDERIITGGSDGYIRYWSFVNIDRAEPSDDNNVLELTPDFEIHVGDNVHIVALVEYKGSWLVQDISGALWNVGPPNRSAGEHGFTSRKMEEFHAGCVTVMLVSPHETTALTTGHDGAVTLIDYVEKKMIHSLPHSTRLTKAMWLPKEMDPNETSAVVSFTDGTIKVLERSEEGLFLREATSAHIDFITDISEKIKNSEERKKREIEMKKEVRRNKIEQLRKQYMSIVELNNQKEEGVRLSLDELQLDRTIKERLERIGEEKLEVARKVLEWDATWADVKLQKLKSVYIDSLDVERIVLKAFKSGQHVESYKTPKIRPALQRLIDHFHAKINEEILKKQRQLEQSGSLLGDDSEENYNDDDDEQSDTKKSSAKSKRRTHKHFHGEKAMEVKKKRHDRMKIKDALLAREPGPTDEDPDIVEEITNAQENMGDYKLKIDDFVIVTDSSRMTAEKKLRQMILLEESMHTLRMVFNVRVLGLRDLKQRLIQKFKQYNEQVNAINLQLGLTEKLVVSPLGMCEIPEDREHIPMEEILEYEREKLAEQRRLAGQRTHLGDLSLDETESFTPVTTDTPNKTQSRKDKTKDVRKGKNMDSLSEVERNELQIKRLELEYEKERILRKKQKQIESFDAAIDELRREKYKLDSDLKHADLRLLLSFHELQILKAYEQKDTVEYTELSKKLQLRNEIANKIIEITTKLAEKKEQISKINIERIKREYNELVPEKHPARDELNRIFKKSSSQNDSDDEYDDDDDDEFDENKTVEKPESCDQETFDRILALKQERIEQEMLLESILSLVEANKKEIEKNQRDLRTIDLDKTKIEKRIKDIQMEKQKHLNELPMIVVLKLSQIQSLLQNKIPADLSDHVVFTNHGLRSLVERIQTLGDERKQLRMRHNELIRSHNSLLKDQKMREEEYSLAKDKVREVQLLKFGKEIDIEELEKAAENADIMALERQLKRSENQAHETMVEWEKSVAEAKDRLVSVTNENTRLLSTLASLRQRQQEIENELDISQVNMVSRMNKSLSNVKVERRKRMQNYALEQTRNIEACKQEITLLAYKVPPPTVTATYMSGTQK